MTPLTATLIYATIGLCFLAGAVFLQARRSLAIGNAKAAPALEAQFREFSVKSFSTIVALYAISFASTVVMPIYAFKTDNDYRVAMMKNIELNDQPISVSVSINPPGPVNVNMHDIIYEDGEADLEVYKSSRPIYYVLNRGPKYGSITIVAKYIRDKGRVSLERVPSTENKWVENIPVTTYNSVSATHVLEFVPTTVGREVHVLAKVTKPQPVDPRLAKLKGPQLVKGTL